VYTSGGFSAVFFGASASFLAGSGEPHPINTAQANTSRLIRITLEYAMLKVPRTMAAYDDFAWFYDRYWNEEFHSLAFPILDRIWLSALPPGAHILDVCCGTGYLANLLAGRGFRVEGLDASAEMISYARSHVPGATFHVGDAASTRLPGQFDAAVSTFDSLNHILTLDELECVFANVFKSLAPGGLFAFDLNMREAFETLWRGTFSSVDDETAAITRGTYDPATGIGRADITLFRLEDGAWRRSDVSVPERCYSEEEIVGALERCGFGPVEAGDAWEVGMRGDVALGRKWFFAAKPGPAQ
jgi:SAM-dependent methyltransferase